MLTDHDVATGLHSNKQNSKSREKLKNVKNEIKYQPQFFLARLLAPAGWPRFYFWVKKLGAGLNAELGAWPSVE